jgi:hypothetical protein
MAQGRCAAHMQVACLLAAANPKVHSPINCDEMTSITEKTPKSTGNPWKSRNRESGILPRVIMIERKGFGN